MVRPNTGNTLKIGSLVELINETSGYTETYVVKKPFNFNTMTIDLGLNKAFSKLTYLELMGVFDYLIRRDYIAPKVD